jgi:hypothetical protein
VPAVGNDPDGKALFGGAIKGKSVSAKRVASVFASGTQFKSLIMVSIPK